MAPEPQLSAADYLDRADDYRRVLALHEERGCVCTKNTLEGLKSRAGETFWDEEAGRDRRYTETEWACIVAGLESTEAKP